MVFAIKKQCIVDNAVILLDGVTKLREVLVLKNKF